MPSGKMASADEEDNSDTKKPAELTKKPRMSDLSPSDFTKTICDYQIGPSVIVTVQDTDYHLPKALLCDNSTFFQSAFNGGFREETEQRVKLEEATSQSFEYAVQWLYYGKINFEEASSVDSFGHLFDFVLLWDFLGLSGSYESIIVQLRGILSHEPDILCSTHITGTSGLPKDHPLRELVLLGCASSYMSFVRGKKGTFKFQLDIEEEPILALNLLNTLEPCLRSTLASGYRPRFDPFRCPRRGKSPGAALS
ncbi:hypothetical protein BJ875DRAFT_481809 [Amylocarpus encephaloides]|uniref:BTB domain-containing protein n=1 Tax=Amylocarpus encephaloides TaxID=45428 RepID=A0A9P7YN33_9HELO|nr:hypothetical protein BJ875DRAFT_481809 [Amylocarpus encephaloides]